MGASMGKEFAAEIIQEGTEMKAYKEQALVY
jgi:hypothetical protein